MSFTSTLFADELIIEDDGSEELHEAPDGMSKGLDFSCKPHDGYGSVQGVEAFPSNLLIPRSDWQAMIQEMEERKTRLSDMSLLKGLPCKDQNGTNYCWINSPTHCVEILRLGQNQPMVILSPASAGAQIKQGQNVGGWGGEGLRFIAEHGLVPVDKWPANQIQGYRNYVTAENKSLAMDYRVTEWWELTPRNLDQIISCVLLRIPVAIGLNWWSHEVTAMDPVWLNGQVALRIRNSWGMGWGDKGFSVLTGSKLLPDDATAPRVAIAA